MAQPAKKAQRFDTEDLVFHLVKRLSKNHAAIEALDLLLETGAAGWWVCYLLHMIELELDKSPDDVKTATPRSIRRVGQQLERAGRIIARELKNDPRYGQCFAGAAA